MSSHSAGNLSLQSLAMAAYRALSRRARRTSATTADERDNGGRAVVHLEAGVHRARVRLVIAKALFRKVHAGQKGVLIIQLARGHPHTALLLSRGKIIGRSFEIPWGGG